MLTSDFDYNLPKELIAQIPVEPRDSSKLMVVDKNKKTIEHRYFADIVDYLKKGDLLVWNNTKVFKARLRGVPMMDEAVVLPSLRRRGKGVVLTDRILNASPVEIFLLRPMENKKVWKVLAKPGRKLRLGMKMVFVPTASRDPASRRDAVSDFSAEVLLKENDGTFLMQFEDDDMVVRAKANKYGEVPTPPYIRQFLSVIPNPRHIRFAQCKLRGEESLSNLLTDRDPSPRIAGASLGMTDWMADRYQTVYAKKEGSVAAPTAGFHFTPGLIEKLKNKGVEFAEVTLHVGLGTFQPVKTEKVEEHKMHSEWVELTAKNADLINQAKAEGRRVVAVGTTTVRALEGIARLQPSAQEREFDSRSPKSAALRPYSGDINIFITPGFEFQIVDALITNFHLPKSTLLMLVSAFAGDTEFIMECYKKAVKEKYRFYSFGDAMFIH